MRRSYWRPAAVKVELKGNAGRVYVYDDENISFEVQVPPPEVFQAFIKELDRLGSAADDVEEYVMVLARAFWLLYQWPRKRGLFRKRYVVPEIDESRSLYLLSSVFPDVKTIFRSLPGALFGLVRYVAPEEKRRIGHGVDYAC